MDSSSESDNDEVTWQYCKYCPSQVPRWAMEKHEMQEHECHFCQLRYPDGLMANHVLRSHSILCEYCELKIVIDQIRTHVHEEHHQEASICRVSGLSDHQFNDMIARNEIFVRDGVLYAHKLWRNESDTRRERDREEERKFDIFWRQFRKLSQINSLLQQINHVQSFSLFHFKNSWELCSN